VFGDMMIRQSLAAGQKKSDNTFTERQAMDLELADTFAAIYKSSIESDITVTRHYITARQVTRHVTGEV
jgi:hypothetical protein